MIGRSLAHYRVLEKLGQGGMGVVYKAEDTRLGRQVALKLLPAGFAGDPDRLTRLQREAQILASLNHPNIAAIYGLEASEGVQFLVLELVAGSDSRRPPGFRPFAQQRVSRDCSPDRRSSRSGARERHRSP